MTAAFDHYFSEYERWRAVYEATPRWRWYRRGIARGRWKLYLDLVLGESL